MIVVVVHNARLGVCLPSLSLTALGITPSSSSALATWSATVATYASSPITPPSSMLHPFLRGICSPLSSLVQDSKFKQLLLTHQAAGLLPESK
ncbi:hypothetical protein BC835DRAFT_118591 [Cytidiella melzeri]|nr:hypothetical protein BC835DRAFT_118591 [Cytidiella melzeri]